MTEPLKDNEIRVLAVRQPWASLIVEGLKTLEVRPRNTQIRERVAIYASYKEDNAHNEWFINLIYRMQDSKVISRNERDKIEMVDRRHGYILGTVELTGTEQIDNQHFYDEPFVNHHLCVPLNKDSAPKYYWKLANPVKFEKPLRYNPPKGAVVWSKTVLPEGY